MSRFSDRALRRLTAQSLEVTRIVEHRYVKALSGVMAAVHREYEKAFATRAPTSAELSMLELRVQAAIPQTVGPLFDRMAKDISASNEKALAGLGIVRGVARPLRKDAIGEVLAKGFREPGLAPAINAARAANIDLISKAGRVYAADVADVFDDPKNAGLRVEDLRDQLVARGNVSKSRAELIARDQTLKLNGQITKIRQQNAGVTSYVWSTSRDDRVREEHADLEGDTIRWDNPPAPGHPGEDFQCRCVAIPVVEELDDIFGAEEPVPPPKAEPPPVPPPKAEPPPVPPPKAEPPPVPPPKAEPPPVPPSKAEPPPVPPPKAEPAQFEVGKHVLQFDDRAGLTPAQVEHMTSAVSSPKMLDYLEKNPLRALETTDQPNVEGRKGALGLYIPRKSTLYVSTAEVPATKDTAASFGNPWVPGTSWTTTVSAATPAASVQATFTHELGHHIHMGTWTTDRAAYDRDDAFILKAYNERSATITQYAGSDHAEYFAESFAAYHLHKDDLLTHDPKGFAMVEAVLKLKGIL